MKNKMKIPAWVRKQTPEGLQESIELLRKSIQKETEEINARNTEHWGERPECQGCPFCYW